MNTIIIMTSNIGSDMLLEEIKEKKDPEKLREDLMMRLRDHFRPEFLNRVDGILIFKSLQMEQIVRILDIQLADFGRRLKDQDVGFSITEAAKKHLAENGYDPEFGARPLKRVIVNEIETPVSKLLISGELRGRHDAESGFCQRQTEIHSGGGQTESESGINGKTEDGKKRNGSFSVLPGSFRPFFVESPVAEVEKASVSG